MRAALIPQIVVNLAIASSAHALEPDKADAWFRRDWAKWASGDAPVAADGCMVTIRYEYHAKPSSMELEQARSEAAGKPGDPFAQGKLRNLASQLRGPSTQLFWFVKDGEFWRGSSDARLFEAATGTSMDFASSRSGLWTLSSGNLVFPSGNTSKSTETNKRSLSPDTNHIFAWLRSGYVANFAQMHPDPPVWRPTETQDRWRAVFEYTFADPATIVRVEVTADWSSEHQRAFVRNWRTSSSATPGVTTEYAVEDWRYEERLGDWVAASITAWKGGQLQSITRLEAVRPLSPAETRAAVEPPTDGAPDPIRGVYHIEKTFDQDLVQVANGTIPHRSTEYGRAVLRPRNLMVVTLFGVVVAVCALRYRRASAVRARAFTLIEIVVVIVVVLVLAALVVRSARGAKESAVHAIELSNLRGNTGGILQYTSDYKGSWPYLTDPAKPESSIIRNADTGLELPTVYFGASEFWHVGLASRYFGGSPGSKVFYSPRALVRVGGSLAGGGPTSYPMSCAFLARPEYWDWSRKDPPHQLRPTFVHEVAFPAAKTTLHASEVYWDYARESIVVDASGVEISTTPTRDRWAASMVDGSVRSGRGSALVPGFRGADGSWRGALHFVPEFPMMHTVRGVQGIDIR